MVAGGLAIIYLFRRLTKAIPSPLVCIVVLTAISLWLGMDELRTVGDLGELPLHASCLPVPGHSTEPRDAADRTSLLRRGGGGDAP